MEGNDREFELCPERLTDILLGNTDNLVTHLLLHLSHHFYLMEEEMGYSYSHAKFCLDRNGCE